MNILVDELTGSALLWGMCLALGYTPEIHHNQVVHTHPGDGRKVSPLFTHEDQMHELMVRHWVGLERPSKHHKSPMWRAVTDAHLTDEQVASGAVARVVSASDARPSVAVCRAIIKAHLGDELDAPFHWTGNFWMPDTMRKRVAP
jgi:hypothetical protein